MVKIPELKTTKVLLETPEELANNPAELRPGLKGQFEAIEIGQDQRQVIDADGRPALGSSVGHSSGVLGLQLGTKGLDNDAPVVTTLPGADRSFAHALYSGLRTLTLGLMLGATTLGVVGCGENSHTGSELATPTTVEQTAGVAESAPKLPAEFVLNERTLSWTTTLDIEAGGRTYGKISRKALSWGTTFRYEDEQGRLLATARAKVFSWGSQVEISDAQGVSLGSIKEIVSQSWTKISTAYEIRDAKGSLVANSEKSEFGSTDFTLTRPGGGSVVTMHRPWLNWAGDNWTVKVQDDSAVDARVLVMIGSFKTAADNDRASSSTSSSSSSKK